MDSPVWVGNTIMSRGELFFMLLGAAIVIVIVLWLASKIEIFR